MVGGVQRLFNENEVIEYKRKSFSTFAKFGISSSRKRSIKLNKINNKTMYNIFVSHSWDHMDDLKGLRRLLNNRGYFNVSFEEFTPENPINSSNIEYMKSRIRERIANSDVVIGMAGVYASYSEWMKWELEIAKSIGKPILGVIPWGQLNVSQVVRDHTKELVRWNTESIVEAIRRLSK